MSSELLQHVPHITAVLDPLRKGQIVALVAVVNVRTKCDQRKISLEEPDSIVECIAVFVHRVLDSIDENLFTNVDKGLT